MSRTKCICPPPKKSIGWVSNPQWDSIQGWILCKVIRFKWGHQSGISMMEDQNSLSLPFSFSSFLFLFLSVRARQEDSCLQARKTAQELNSPTAWCWTFQPLDPQEICVCCLSHAVCIVYKDFLLVIFKNTLRDLALTSWIWHQNHRNKSKISKLGYTKMKSFCTSKDTINRVKRQHLE